MLTQLRVETLFDHIDHPLGRARPIQIFNSSMEIECLGSGLSIELSDM
jgi:hypothetical protein